MKVVAYIGYALLVIALFFDMLSSENLTWFGAIAALGFTILLLALPFLEATHETLRDVHADMRARRRCRRSWWW